MHLPQYLYNVYFKITGASLAYIQHLFPKVNYLDNIQRTMYTVRRTVYVLRTFYILFCIHYSALSILYILFVEQCMDYIIRCTVYSVYSTRNDVRRSLYFVHCTSNNIRTIITYTARGTFQLLMSLLQPRMRSLK